MMNNRITILNVDDEPINLKLFEINFGKKNIVITANSGYEGLTKLKLNPDIKIVISDMSMPGMNGIEFIRLAKEDFPNIVFYILTGYGLTEEISAALDDNLINKYFSKPLNAKEIELSIEKVKSKF
jgi:two-component system, response regulator, stage 0 sporulation protein F